MRIFKEILRIAALLDDALVHKNDLRADLACKAHFVCHNDHGHALSGELLHDLQHFADHFGVKRRGRLVKEHNVRIHCQRAHDRHTLLLTAGELVGICVRLVGKSDAFEQLEGVLFRLRPALMQKLYGTERHVFENGLVRKEVELLEHHTHFLAVQVDVHGGVGDVDALKGDGAACRLLQKVQAAQKGGFAGAGRTDNDHHVAASDLGVNTL